MPQYQHKQIIAALSDMLDVVIIFVTYLVVALAPVDTLQAVMNGMMARIRRVPEFVLLDPILTSQIIPTTIAMYALLVLLVNMYPVYVVMNPSQSANYVIMDITSQVRTHGVCIVTVINVLQVHMLVF